MYKRNSILVKATEPSRPYRIIFNMDSSGVLPASKDVDDYLLGIVDFLENTHVDALFWHDGAGGNTANYDSEVLELTGERIGAVNPFLMKLIEAGNDPPKIVVREARKRGVDVFYSFRINDCHDSLDHAPLLATFKVEHPDWTIGEGHPYGGHLNLDFAIPEVRELKFAVIDEIVQKYDFDGLEIDFLRSPPYFIPGSEPEHAHLLTQFLQRVREHLDQRGQERGRPLKLAARVDESMEACRLDGFDVATWVQKGLIDILALGSGAIDIEVEQFKMLTEGTGIPVYPCVYGWPSGYRPPIAPGLHRALATNYWHQGADGIYTFNWNAHSYVHRPKEHSSFADQISLLCELDNPETMQGKDKLYAADRGGPTRVYPHNWMHCVLPLSLETGAQADIPIMVGEDLALPPLPDTLKLRIDIEEFSPDCRLQLELNQHSLPAISRPDSPIEFDLEPDQLKTGRNRVRISLEQGNLIATSLEIHVSY